MQLRLCHRDREWGCGFGMKELEWVMGLRIGNLGFGFEDVIEYENQENDWTLSIIEITAVDVTQDI